ncbi:MAG: class I SAM-dependent methyltransferase [Patescibacteria group bacterium]
MQNEIKIFVSKDWVEYELIDTGAGEKLERFGLYTFVRPYENAVWQKTLPESEWNKADGKFWSSKSGGKGGLASLKQRQSGWKITTKISDRWEMSYKGIKFFASPTPFRHLGFFPEQASHWDFIEEKISKANLAKNFLETAPSEAKGQGIHTFLKNSLPNSLVPKIKFLNLFGYTGVASFFALRAGAEVTHLDASKQTLNWAKENQKLSGLQDLPMRVIEDDAIKFLEREIKRGNKYDAIVMDPPKFGRGPKGEIWKIEEMLPKLLSAVQKVLSAKPLFVILTSYATDSSSLSLGYALEEMMKDFSGSIESGELCVLEKSNNRIIPLANTAVWSI